MLGIAQRLELLERFVVEDHGVSLPQRARRPSRFEEGSHLRAKVSQRPFVPAEQIVELAGVRGEVVELFAHDLGRSEVAAAVPVARLRPQRRTAADRGALEASLRDRLEDWRRLLRRNVVQARPVLETLLAGRVIVTPRLVADQLEAFDVRIPLTLRGIFEGIACPQAVASPTGFEPVF